MKKLIATALATAMVLSLAACGGGAAETTAAATTAAATTAAAAETEAPAETEAAAPAEAEYVIKLANPSNPDDNVVKGFYYFEQIVEERSNGRIDVQVFDSGQLGGHADYVDSMQMHSLQAAEVNTSVLGNLEPLFGIFDMPYLVSGQEELESILQSGLGEELDKDLQEAANLKIVGWFIRSPRSVYTNKGPVSSLADMAGTKIRIMESAIMSRTMELLGMVPVPLAATERYMALQTGTVDAAENSIPLIITQAEYEVTKYVVLTKHTCTPNVMCMDLDYYNDLPDDLRAIVDECGAEAGKYSMDLDAEGDVSALEELESEYGMTICEIEDMSEFEEAVAPLYDEYRDQLGEIYHYFGR